MATITTFIISFREFLEAFLIIGVFLVVSRTLGLKREKEILCAALTGIVLSLLLPTVAYLAGEHAKAILTEENADAIQAYLMVFSGFFIAYVVFSLHQFFRQSRDLSLKEARDKITQRFDVALFFTIVFFIFREGFEVALFTATASLLASFRDNMVGLLFGFALSSLVGLGTFFAYITIPMGKVFKYTEYLIIFVGASLVKNGLTAMAELHLHLDLGSMLPLPLGFLPDQENSFVGHALNNLVGVEAHLSAAKLAIMALYGALVVLVLRRKKVREAIEGVV